MKRLCLVLLVILGHQTLAKQWKKQQLPSLNSEPEENFSGQVMENQTQKPEKSLLNYPPEEDLNVVLSKKCSGKPDAPEHATVHCFKKRNTCRATCQSGYIFSKKGSKFAIYDCQGGKWVMRDGEDRCHRNESTLILNSKTDTKTSRKLPPIYGSNAHRRKEVKCVYPEDYDYDYDDNQKSKSENKNSLDHASSNIKLNQIEINHIKNEKNISKSKNQIKIKKSNHIKSNQIKSNNERKTHQRKEVRCIIPADYGYSHGHDNYSCHSHYYYYDDYYDDYYYANHDQYHDSIYTYDDYYGDYYLCKGTGYCIVDFWVCDNIVDCPDGDDELDCYKGVSTSTVGPTSTVGLTATDYDLTTTDYYSTTEFDIMSTDYDTSTTDYNRAFSTSTVAPTTTEFDITTDYDTTTTDSCWENDKVYENGQIIETILATCTIRRCLMGLIKEEKPFGNLNGCCLNPNTNKMVPPGSKIDAGGCAVEICINRIWLPDPIDILANCNRCIVWGEPHFRAFSGVAFDWHIGCNHALVQEGDSMNPDFGVFMDFTRYIGDKIAIVNEDAITTYKEDTNTVVVINIDQDILEVNGHANHITSTTPTFLVRSDGTETTAMAWKTSTSTWSSCIRLYGKPQILVELCRYQISIWVATWKPGHSRLGGLCGSTDPAALDERKLVARDGSKYDPPSTNDYDYYYDYYYYGWSSQQLSNENFGFSWQTTQQTKDGCPAQTGADLGGYDYDWNDYEWIRRRKRDAEDPQMVCSNVTNSPYKDQCKKIVQESGINGTDRKMLYNSCMFDLCVVVKFPQPEILTYDDMVKQIKQITVQAKTQQDNTIESVPVETKCPIEWSPVGGQCFQEHKFNEGLSLYEALQYCISINSTLAQPHDITAFNNFIRDALLAIPGANKDGYWLGGRLMDEAMEWLVGGGLIPNDQFMIGIPHADPTEPNNCLEIPIQHEDTLDTHPQVNCKCSSCMDISQYIDIRSDSSINAQIQIKQVVRSVNNRKETLTVKPSPNICIEPEVFVCEIEPLP